MAFGDDHRPGRRAVIHSDDTLFTKAQKVLTEAGLTDEGALNALRKMQEAGVFLKNGPVLDDWSKPVRGEVEL